MPESFDNRGRYGKVAVRYRSAKITGEHRSREVTWTSPAGCSLRAGSVPQTAAVTDSPARNTGTPRTRIGHTWQRAFGVPASGQE